MHIEKRGYSRHPWRLVTEDGREVCIPSEVQLPSTSGFGDTREAAVIPHAVMGNTRRECEAAAMRLLSGLIDQHLAAQADQGGGGDA